MGVRVAVSAGRARDGVAVTTTIIGAGTAAGTAVGVGVTGTALGPFGPPLPATSAINAPTSPIATSATTTDRIL